MHTFLCTPPVFYWKCSERTNHYAIKTLLNLGNSATYDFCLAMADMDKLEQRRTLQSRILFFKCFKLDGPNYISQFFTPRLTKYNLRDSGLNVVQPPYNILVMHNSFQYTWLPTYGINYQLPPNPRALKHNFVLAWIMSISQGASVWTVYNFIYFYISTYSWASLYIIISNYIF